MVAAATEAATSCIRRIRAPPSAQAVAAAIDGASRSGFGQPGRLADEVLVGDRREQTAARARRSRASRRVSSRECRVFLFRS